MEYKHYLSKLTDETPTSYYWMGFIFADGSISDNNRMTLVLSKKDSDHIKKFVSFIGGIHPIKDEKRYDTCGIKIMDSYNVPYLSAKFDIKPRKTYNPPSIHKLNNVLSKSNLFYSFIIGFIDGDGCIHKQTGRADCGLIIKLHKSWVNILQYFSNRVCYNLQLKPNIVHINKYGYAEVRFTNSIILKHLKRKGYELNLPWLDRKWGLIDTNYVSRIEQAVYNVNNVRKLANGGKKNKEMSQILKLSPSAITMIMKRNDIKYNREK